MRALGVPWAVAELERRYRQARSALAAQRYQALWLRAQGRSVREVAATVGVTTETLRAWIKRATAEGLDALGVRKAGSGGHPKLDAAQRAAVLGWVGEEPRTTMPALQRRIAQEWGIRLSTPQVWKLVRRGGGRPVVPRMRHYQADAAAQAAAQKN
jgi:transposase